MLEIVKESEGKRQLKDVECEYIINTGSGKFGQSIVTVIFKNGNEPLVWVTTSKTAALRSFEEGKKYDIAFIQYSNAGRYINNVKAINQENKIEEEPENVENN